MKRLLVISYGYAPTNVIGIMRVIKFVKFLARWGWQSVVVTPRHLPSYPQDSELLAEVPAGTEIITTPSFEPQDLVTKMVSNPASPTQTRPMPGTQRRSIQLAAAWYRWFVNFFWFPDDMAAWNWLGRRAVDRAIRTFKPQAILSSAPPYTAHLMARRARLKYGLPWIADFRDEWTENPYRSYSTPWHRRWSQRLEQRVLSTADVVTGISEPMTASLARLAPHRSAETFHTIYNGYDEEDFSDQVAPSKGRFVITYTGNFYGHRSPNTFFRAAASFISNRGVKPESFRIRFVGGNAYRVDPDLDLKPLAPYLEFQSTVPHRRAIELMRQSSVLLLVISAVDGVGRLPAKIFEYLASRRPILALAPEEVRGASIIREAKAGVIADPNSVGSTLHALETLYDAWKDHRLEQRFPCLTPTQFSREQQSRVLFELLERLTQQSP